MSPDITDEQLVEAARTKFAAKSNGEIEIEIHGLNISRGDGGAWVKAWVWISDEDIT